MHLFPSPIHVGFDVQMGRIERKRSRTRIHFAQWLFSFRYSSLYSISLSEIHVIQSIETVSEEFISFWCTNVNLMWLVMFYQMFLSLFHSYFFFFSLFPTFIHLFFLLSPSLPHWMKLQSWFLFGHHNRTLLSPSLFLLKQAIAVSADESSEGNIKVTDCHLKQLLHFRTLYTSHWNVNRFCSKHGTLSRDKTR